MLRLIAIAAWIAFTTIGWYCLVIGSLLLAIRLDPARTRAFLRSIPEPLATAVFFYGLLAIVPLAVMSVTSYFALSGQLPGTHRVPRKSAAGFPVRPSIS